MEAQNISARCGWRDRTRILPISRNPEYRFHQAWVRRQGFRSAANDRILSVDVDLVLNGNVRKAIGMVGEDDIGFVSCATMRPAGEPFEFIRASVDRLVSLWQIPPLTGVYAIWRPYWLDSEDDGIRRLEDPRSRTVGGSLVAVTEDAYLLNCMKVKHRVVHLREVGAYCRRQDYNLSQHAQYELGRYYAERGSRMREILVKTFALLKPQLFTGYVHQKRRPRSVPAFNPETYPITGANAYAETREFWSKSIPMSFEDQSKSYSEKRAFRYALQNYMQEAFEFNRCAGKRVLEIGVGAGIDSAEFLRHDAELVGVDFSPLAIRKAKQLLHEAGLHGEIVLADARYLPFRDSLFDFAYSYGVIHHIPNVDDVLVEVRRSLRRKGLFMGMVYNRDSLLYSYSIIYLQGIKQGLLRQGATELDLASNFSERLQGNRYTWAYTGKELGNLLRRHFRHVWIQSYYNVIDTEHERKVKFRLRDGSNALGWHLVFRAVR